MSRQTEELHNAVHELATEALKHLRAEIERYRGALERIASAHIPVASGRLNEMGEWQRIARDALPPSAQGQRQMTQAEREAMGRAFEKSVTVVDHGYSASPKCAHCGDDPKACRGRVDEAECSCLCHASTVEGK